MAQVYSRTWVSLDVRGQLVEALLAADEELLVADEELLAEEEELVWAEVRAPPAARSQVI
jgi:hypothetical protein